LRKVFWFSTICPRRVTVRHPGTGVGAHDVFHTDRLLDEEVTVALIDQAVDFEALVAGCYEKEFGWARMRSYSLG
jgi:hypothetical protein